MVGSVRFLARCWLRWSSVALTVAVCGGSRSLKVESDVAGLDAAFVSRGSGCEAALV